MAFAADGRQALYGGVDRTVRLWDTETGEEIGRIEHDAVPRRPVMDVAMTPDSRFAMSGGDDTTARLWDLRTGRELHRFTNDRTSVDRVAISSDGRRGVGAIGPAACVWDLSEWLPKE